MYNGNFKESKLKNNVVIKSIYSNKFFWLNVGLTVFSIGALQLVIYFGSKYGFIPVEYSNMLWHLTDDHADFINTSVIAWDLPFYIELPLFLFVFAMMNMLIKERNRNVSIDKERRSSFYFIRTTVVFMVYFIFLANSSIGRFVIYKTIPEDFKRSVILNCTQKIVQIGDLKFYNKHSSLCDYCSTSDNQCLYSGLETQ